MLKLLKQILAPKETPPPEPVDDTKRHHRALAKTALHDWDKDIYGLKAVDNPFIKKPLPSYSKYDRPFLFNLHPKTQANINVRSWSQFIAKQAREAEEKYSNKAERDKAAKGDFKQWQAIANRCYELSNNVCSVCGQTSVGDYTGDKTIKHPVECHEVWQFESREKDGQTVRVQKLIDLQCLCVRCHNTKHIDQFSKNEDDEPRFIDCLNRRYARFNNISKQRAQKDYEAAVRERTRREAHRYQLDLSLLGVDELFDPFTEPFQAFLRKDFNKGNSKD